MTWQPNLSNVIHPMPTFNLLKKAVWGLYAKNIIEHPMEILSDSYGRYGFRYQQFILVAKNSIYGNIISVHREAVLKAMLHKIGIIVYIADAKKYYWFNPEQLYNEGEENHKGLSQMLNFSIRLGKLQEW